MKRSLKSTRARMSPKGGMTMSLTSDVTILPKAAPMMTPMARSTTLPRMANSRNSFHMASLPKALRAADHVAGRRCTQSAWPNCAQRQASAGPAESPTIAGGRYGRRGHAEGTPGRGGGSAPMTMQPAIRRQAPRAARVLGAAGLPAWMRGLIAVAVGSAVLGLGLLVVALTALSGQSLARPLAIVLIFVAAACGLASLAARQVHAALAGRVDLLSQPPEASPNAHLEVAHGGSRCATAPAAPPGSATRRICSPDGPATACGASRTSPRATRWSR